MFDVVGCGAGQHVAASGQVADVRGRGETILLVDDAEHMRSVMADILQSLNYKVLIACDGIEALRLFTNHQAELRLVITDVAMPRMDGFELVRYIRQQNERLPVIFVTGYHNGYAIPAGQRIEKSMLFRKPFSHDLLHMGIRTLLDL